MNRIRQPVWDNFTRPYITYTFPRLRGKSFFEMWSKSKGFHNSKMSASLTVQFPVPNERTWIDLMFKTRSSHLLVSLFFEEFLPPSRGPQNIVRFRSVRNTTIGIPSLEPKASNTFWKHHVQSERRAIFGPWFGPWCSLLHAIWMSVGLRL